jgi:hypothetical protein
LALVAIAFAVVTGARVASADEPVPPPSAPAPAADAEEAAAIEAFRSYSGRPAGYARLFGTLAFGEGLRFNNPFRLSTELGSTGQSVSLTASYVDFGLAMTFGKPDGIQYGAALHFSSATSGISQQVLIPSAIAVYRGPHRVMEYLRLGPAIILDPDANVGPELAAGFAFFLTSKIAVAGDVIGDLFYGAGTRQVRYAAYPILSGQLGILVDNEWLP